MGRAELVSGLLFVGTLCGIVPAILYNLIILSCDALGFWALIPYAAALAWLGYKVVVPRGRR